MIKPMLSHRNSRFAKLWMMKFAKVAGIGLASVIAGGTIGGSIGYLVVLAGQAYGFKVVLIGIALTWLIMLVGVVSGAMAEDQLNKMEREEDRVMRKLKRWP